MIQYSPTMPNYSQFTRIILLEKYILFPVKAVIIIGILLSVYFYNLFPQGTPLFFRHQILLYVLSNLIFGYIIIQIGQHKFNASIVKIGAFFLSIIDSLFLSLLIYATDGATSNLYWAYCGLMIRNAINFPTIQQQTLLNLMLVGFYVGASLAERQEIASDYQEVFWMRCVVLVLMSGCCWGIYSLLIKKNIESERKREIQTRQQKFFSTGKLASEVAHGLKNPLAIINNASYAIQKKINDAQNPMFELAQIIREEVAHADRLLVALLDYSKQSMVDIRAVNISEIIQNCVDHTRPEFMHQDIQIQTHFEENLPNLFADIHHLEQIFSNLIHNAIEAMAEEERGTLIIHAFYEDDDLWIEFEDSGPGIDPNDVEKIFKPFYTTKRKGTGLGLSIVKNLVESYDGEVIIKSKARFGMKISIRFPIHMNTRN